MWYWCSGRRSSPQTNVVVYAVGGGRFRNSRIVGDHIIEGAIAVDAVGHALCCVCGINQIASGSSRRADSGARCAVSAAGDLHGISRAVGALKAETVPAGSASQFGRQRGESCRMFTKIQRPKVNAVLSGRAINQSAVGQGECRINGAIAGHRLRPADATK